MLNDEEKDERIRSVLVESKTINQKASFSTAIQNALRIAPIVTSIL